MPGTTPSTTRVSLRSALLARRAAFVQGPLREAAERSLATHLKRVLGELEPALLGLYWPIRSEFNAPLALAADPGHSPWLRALPFCRKVPVEMHYRAWDGGEPLARDECKLASADGSVVVPDVVLVPCVGFTRSGQRLGYGGGYFDRWLAVHPHVTSVGVAWAVGEVAEAAFVAESHDQGLSFVVTEEGVV